MTDDFNKRFGGQRRTTEQFYQSIKIEAGIRMWINLYSSNLRHYNKKVKILLYKGFQPIVNSERISTKCDFRNTISTLHVTFKDMKKLCTFDSLEMHTIRL